MVRGRKLICLKLWGRSGSKTHFQTHFKLSTLEVIALHSQEVSKKLISAVSVSVLNQNTVVKDFGASPTQLLNNLISHGRQCAAVLSIAITQM